VVPPDGTVDETGNNTASTEVENASVLHPQRRLILWVLIAGIAAASFPVTVLGAAIPEIAANLNSTDATTSWVLAGPLLGVAVATPITGKLGDLFGHRPVYIIGLCLSTLMGVATGFAWDIGSLIGFRTLSQMFGAATGPAALAIIMHIFPREERAPAIGLWSAISAVSPTVGIVVGGPLIDAVSWRVIFFMQSGLALIGLVAAILVLPRTNARQQVQFDILGALTLGSGVTALLLSLNRSSAWGFSDPRIIGGASAGVLLLVLFYQVELRAEAPLLPPVLLKRGDFSRPVSSQLFTIGPYMGSFVVTPIMLERVFGYSTTARGLLMILRPIAFSLGSWTGGRRAEKLGARRMGVTGAALIGLGTALTGLAGTSGAVILVVLSLAIAGWGNGLGRPALLSRVSEAVDEADFGMAGASFNVGGQIGAAAWITLLTAILGESSSPGRFLLVYLIAAGATAIAIAILAGLSQTARPLP